MSNKTDFNELSVAERERAIKLLMRAEEQKIKDRRYWTKMQLMVEKAKAAGIEVTDEEIDARLARKSK